MKYDSSLLIQWSEYPEYNKKIAYNAQNQENYSLKEKRRLPDINIKMKQMLELSNNIKAAALQMH